MKLQQFIIIVLLGAMLSSACGQDSPTSVPEAAPQAITATLVSAATNTPNAPQSPLTTSPLATPTPAPKSADAGSTTQAMSPDYQARTLPKPEKGQAVLAGRVLAQFGDKPGFESVITSAVYLAPVIYEKDGTPSVASLDSQYDPSSSTDPEGYFLFENVKPGQYGFVIYYGVTHYLIRDDAGVQVLITLEADQVLDLGEMHTNLPDTW